MKVLWICNMMLPMVSKHLGLEVSNKEGWLTGLADMILQNKSDNNVELAVACPIGASMTERMWEVPVEEYDTTLLCYGFVEDVEHPESYAKELETQIQRIIEEFQPDVVHCFGTEYPHTMAVAKICEKEKVLIGIQGLCKVCAQVYLADLPERVVKRVTFRDWLRRDSILQQKKKFIARGEREETVLRNAGHITGRTWLDRKYVADVNGDAQYHFMNETLRSNFYEGSWEPDKCEKYSIFMSQGDYPLKGLHYMLKAMPKILEKYPQAKVYVAGNSITRYETWKDKIKISSYGKYIRELVEEYGLQDKVTFLGRLDAEEMKAQFLKSNVFVCASAIENSPNSLGEAMILGVPCVTAMVGGIRTVFTNGEDGITYPGYGDEEYAKSEDKEQAQAERLAEAVLAMWSDEDRMLAYTQNARKHAGLTHNGQNNYARLVEIYREITKK